MCVRVCTRKKGTTALGAQSITHAVRWKVGTVLLQLSACIIVVRAHFAKNKLTARELGEERLGQDVGDAPVVLRTFFLACADDEHRPIWSGDGGNWRGRGNGGIGMGLWAVRPEPKDLPRSSSSLEGDRCVFLAPMDGPLAHTIRLRVLRKKPSGSTHTCQEARLVLLNAEGSGR